jgi:ABC-type branched-subunit amino acid transport system substrate-binding protein
MKNTTEQNRRRLIRKRLSILWLALALVGILSAVFVFQTAKPADRNPTPPLAADPKRSDLHVGILAPLQGDLKPYGESIVRGATLAASEINEAGGVLGLNVKLHIADTRSNPELAAELTDDLIRRVQVSLIIGTASEEEALAAAAVATRGQTPFIYLANGALKTCSVNNIKVASDYVWGTGLTEYMTVEPFLIYLADRFRQPETKFGIYYFGTDDEESRNAALFAIQSAESLGFETIAEDYVDQRILDYFQKIRTIFRLKPDLLFVTTAKRSSALFLQQSSKLGVKAEMAVAGIHPFEHEIVLPLAESLDSIYTVVRYTQSIDSDENRAFLEQWRKRYPNPAEQPTGIAVGGAYTALSAAKAAFEKAGAQDSGSFREAMKNLEIEVPQGRVVVSAINNLFIQPLYAVQFNAGDYEIQEFLGDVSHPSLEACTVLQHSFDPQKTPLIEQ